MNVERTVEPLTEPVTLDEAKEYLRVTDCDDDDAYITSLISVARRMVEDMTGRVLIDTVFTQSAHSWCPWLDILRGNARTVNSVVYQPADGGPELPVDSSLYEIEKYGDGKAQLVFDEEFDEPELMYRMGVSNIRIEFVAGYGAAAVDVPQPLVQAIKFLVSHYYENRTPVTGESVPRSVPMTVDHICNNYKIYNL